MPMCTSTFFIVRRKKRAGGEAFLHERKTVFPGEFDVTTASKRLSHLLVVASAVINRWLDWLVGLGVRPHFYFYFFSVANHDLQKYLMKEKREAEKEALISFCREGAQFVFSSSRYGLSFVFVLWLFLSVDHFH